MKNTALFLALFVGVAFSTSTFAAVSFDEKSQAGSEKSNDSLNDLKDTTVGIWVFKKTNIFGGGDRFWANFEWAVMDDNTAILFPVAGPSSYSHPWTLSPDITLTTDYTVTVRDENFQVISECTFDYGQSLITMASYLMFQKLRLGKDSIQITHTAIDYHVRVKGKVGNFNKINFEMPTKWQIDNYAFTPRKKNLRAFYIHQDRIDNDQYLINNQQKSLTTNPYDNLNVFVQYFPQSDNPFTKWRVTYDNDKFAYRIVMPVPNSSDRNLAWTPSRGHNVFAYNKLPNADQYWLFKKSETINQYEIISAADVTKYLNVDSDQRNVSVANQTHSSDQLFSLEPINADDK